MLLVFLFTFLLVPCDKSYGGAFYFRDNYGGSNFSEIQKENALAEKYKEEAKTEKVRRYFLYALGGSVTMLSVALLVIQIKKKSK